MKIKANYRLRDVAGETIVVNQGSAGADLTRIISLNSTAKLLWEELAGAEFSLEDAAELLVKTFGIDKQRALEDAAAWSDSLKSCGVMEE